MRQFLAADEEAVLDAFAEGGNLGRVQRDAVLAAFAEDDWWFHSFARGYMPWVAYGINQNWTVQASGFFERRDGVDEYTERLLLDLRSRW